MFTFSLSFMVWLKFDGVCSDLSLCEEFSRGGPFEFDSVGELDFSIDLLRLLRLPTPGMPSKALKMSSEALENQSHLVNFNLFNPITKAF